MSVNSSGDTGYLVSRRGTTTLDVYPVGVVRSSITCAPWQKSETSTLHLDTENGAGLCESQDETLQHSQIFADRDRRSRGTATLPCFDLIRHYE